MNRGDGTRTLQRRPLPAPARGVIVFLIIWFVRRRHDNAPPVSP